MSEEHVKDGRKYQVGEEVDFTDDNGKVVPGVVHAVRYQQGRYELIGAQRPDMHTPEGPGNPVIPGTGQMQLIPGTENERHSFEYIMVHKHEHKAWWDTEKANQKHIKAAEHHKIKSHPELKQHIRIFEEDEAAIDTTEPQM